MALQLNKANSILRHIFDIKTLRSVYCAIFEPHLCYASLVWAQNTNSVKRLHLFQKKSLRLMFFQSRNCHTSPLFNMSKILKSFDKTAHETHSHDTRCSNLGYLKKYSYHTKTYGRYSMFVNSIYVWNHLQSCHQNVVFS